MQISREPGGDVLIADALSVDLHRFPHLASQARATADPLDAVALFDRALDLWRDEPFAFLDTPRVNDVRTALEAERLSVALDRNDVALRAPDHTPSASASFAAETSSRFSASWIPVVDIVTPFKVGD